MSKDSLNAAADESIFHPQDVLVKTEQGNQESRIQTSESSLPRRLRTLLMVVDGKTPFHVYEKTLASYGDVASLYEALVTSGYLASSARPRSGSSGPEPVPAPADETESAVVADEEVVLETRPESGAAEAGNPEQPRGRGLDSHKFRELMSDISTLVTEHLGSNSMELLLKVEAVNSPQQLLDLLPELAEELKPSMGNRDVKRFVSEVRKQLA